MKIAHAGVGCAVDVADDGEFRLRYLLAHGVQDLLVAIDDRRELDRPRLLRRQITNARELGHRQFRVGVHLRCAEEIGLRQRRIRVLDADVRPLQRLRPLVDVGHLDAPDRRWRLSADVASVSHARWRNLYFAEALLCPLVHFDDSLGRRQVARALHLQRLEMPVSEFVVIALSERLRIAGFIVNFLRD